MSGAADPCCGFAGKLPARGDFVGSGLPPTFSRPWTDWVDAAVAESRAATGDSWLPAWLEAPIWRFALPAGAAGPDAALGLILPSVDRVGRYYPLTVAAIFAGRDAMPDPDAGAGWLAAAAAVALDALAHDAAPDAVAASLAALAPPDGGASAPPGAALWWTDGSPRVPAGRMAPPGLPAPGCFARMIGAEPA